MATDDTQTRLDAIRGRLAEATMADDLSVEYFDDVPWLAAELERVSRSNEELRGEVEIKNEEISTLTAALRDAERECEEAAARWRASADKERREGSRSSMCGEEGVPSHVITTARAISWEGAAKTIAALAGGLTRIEDSSTSDSTELNSARAAQEGDV
jgi:predicted RNase H-like nuclease (RuvC/YqgF family)